MAIVFNADNRFYYSKLNTAEKRLYKFMADCLINNQYKFIYINEFDTVPVNNDLPMFVYKIDEFIIASKVWTSLIMDCPEFYYVEEYDFILDDNVALMGKENPYYTQTEIEEINKALDDIYHNFDHLNDEYEIELAVNDYIINNYQYDYETTDYYIDENDWMFDINLWRRSREKFNVVGLIKYKKGVCSAFTHLAQYIFQRKE